MDEAKIKRMKKVFKLIVAAALLFGAYVAGVLIYGTINDWSPVDLIEVPVQQNTEELMNDSVFTMLTWNIGFTGLGEETSFFYDGGETVIQTKKLVDKNRLGIIHFLKDNPVDFCLLQEVDSCSKRSHRINFIEEFKDSYEGHSNAFAMNYKVKFVPLPIFEPMGEVNSGLLNMSRYNVTESQRHAYDSQFEWPRRLFFLDRCFLSQRVPMSNGKDLIVINTHCSAYDKDGSMVKAEVQKLLNYAEEEFKKGNYVAIGGDWNQCPPGYEFKDSTLGYNEKSLTESGIPSGWKWVSDIEVPSNRKLDRVYDTNSYTSVIDHFLISPNLGVEDVHCEDLDFKFSDHQPVFITLRFND